MNINSWKNHSIFLITASISNVASETMLFVMSKANSWNRDVTKISYSEKKLF